jgi:hypothetical protein
MKMHRILSRLFCFSRPRRAAALMVFLALLASCSLALPSVRLNAMLLLQAVNNRMKAARSSAVPPQLTVETNGSFEYEQWVQMMYRAPTSPNTWHLASTITNTGSNAVEVVPVYLYSEVSPSDAAVYENSATISPKSYVQDFSSEAQKGITTAPEDLTGKIEMGVALPMDQLDHFPDSPGSLAAMVGSRTFDAAIAVDAKPAAWGKLKVGPHSTISATWEFPSIWAAPRKLRFDKAFEVIHLGPVVRSLAAPHPPAYLVAVHLNYEPGEAITLKQASFQLIKVTPNLPQELLKTFPNNRVSVTEFGNAVTKIAAEP